MNDWKDFNGITQIIKLSFKERLKFLFKNNLSFNISFKYRNSNKDFIITNVDIRETKNELINIIENETKPNSEPAFSENKNWIKNDNIKGYS